MTQPDWDHKHPGDYPAYADSQHGPNLHTHGADGKVDTVLGKSTNPMNSRCGLEDCDCEYTIDKLQEGLRQVQRIAHDLSECVDTDGDCPCYEEGLQEGRESERRPVGA